MFKTFRHKYQYFVTIQVDGELRNISQHYGKKTRYFNNVMNC